MLRLIVRAAGRIVRYGERALSQLARFSWVNRSTTGKGFHLDYTFCSPALDNRLSYKHKYKTRRH